MTDAEMGSKYSKNGDLSVMGEGLAENRIGQPQAQLFKASPLIQPLSLSLPLGASCSADTIPFLVQLEHRLCGSYTKKIRAGYRTSVLNHAVS